MVHATHDVSCTSHAVTHAWVDTIIEGRLHTTVAPTCLPLVLPSISPFHPTPNQHLNAHNGGYRHDQRCAYDLLVPRHFLCIYIYVCVHITIQVQVNPVRSLS
jgi:hypothetical protein